MQFSKQKQLVVFRSLQEVFQVSSVILISSSMSEIVTAQVHSGWDGGRMDDALFSKTILDN